MRIFSRILNTLPKRLAAGALIALAVILPVAVSAAQTISISATTGVANVTAGDTSYSSSINAAYNQVIKVEVTYTNDEAPSSGLVANNVVMKINIPTTSGTSQTVTSTVGGSNTNTVNGSAIVNLAQSGFLQYVPGSAQVRITEPDGTVSPVTAIPDGIITGGGYVINNGNPCQSAAVAVEAQVMVPGVSVTKQVADKSTSSTTWVTNDTANPGDLLKYLITYQNAGNTEENQVVIRDVLPTGLTLVPNSTYLTDASFPNGVLINDANGTITTVGLVAGDFDPGYHAYVTLEATLPTADQLSCGTNQFTNKALVTPQGMGTYSAIATTTVTNNCTPPSSPTYACVSVGITQGDHSAAVNTFQQNATNGATFTGATINWGDGAITPPTTDVIGQVHNYSGNGLYTITATADFTVNNQTVTATSTNCTQTVSFTTPTTPPTVLVNTGPGGDAIAFFGLATVIGALGYNLFLRRSVSKVN